MTLTVGTTDSLANIVRMISLVQLCTIKSDDSGNDGRANERGVNISGRVATLILTAALVTEKFKPLFHSSQESSRKPAVSACI